MTSTLDRRLGTTDAVVIGLGSMLGAGVFVVFAPATAAAGGPGMLLALALAGLVAFGNATSSARLAARYPESGGTYVYGRERLGDLAGFLAGWGFVAGKTASCAAMALTIGAYLAPHQARVVGLVALTAVTAVNLLGAGVGQRAGRVRGARRGAGGPRDQPGAGSIQAPARMTRTARRSSSSTTRSAR